MKVGTVLGGFLLGVGLVLVVLGGPLLGAVGAPITLLGAIIIMVFLAPDFQDRHRPQPPSFEREVVSIMKAQNEVLEDLNTRLAKLEEKAPKPRKVLSTVKQTADGGYESTSGVPDWKEIEP